MRNKFKRIYMYWLGGLTTLMEMEIEAMEMHYEQLRLSNQCRKMSVFNERRALVDSAKVERGRGENGKTESFIERLRSEEPNRTQLLALLVILLLCCIDFS